jgi:hypothetical protein
VFRFRKGNVQWLDIFPLENKFNNHIGIDLNIGTPTTTLTLNVEFYTNSVWLFHPMCHDMSISMNINQQPFHYMKSLTYVNDTDNNMYTLKGRSYIKAFKGNDIVLTHNNNNNNDNVLSTANVTLFICERLTDININSGILGVNIYNEDDTLTHNTKGFIPQLKDNNVITHEMFYFKYINNTHGDFIIGEYPLHHANYIYKPINNNNKWEITINKVIYDFENTNNNVYTYNIPIRFKIEYGFIIGPNSLYTILQQQVLRTYIENKQCVYHDNIHYHYHTFMCKKEIINESFYKKFPRFVFKFGNNNDETITINREELFEDINNNNNNNNEYKCFAIAFGEFDLGDGWIFGEKIFKQYNILFDIANTSIGVLFNNESIIIKKRIIIYINIITLFIYTIYVIYIKQYVHI